TSSSAPLTSTRSLHDALPIYSIDAPIDGFMLSKSPKNVEGAKQLLQFLSTGEAQMVYLASDPTSIAAAKDAKTDTYTPLQKKARSEEHTSELQSHLNLVCRLQ